MAFTQTMLDSLEAAYAAGVLAVRHEGKSIQYDSLESLWQAILRIRQALAPTSKKPISGRAGYKRY